MSKPSIKKLTTAKAEAETGRRAGEIEDLLLPSRGIESIASLAGLSKLRKLDLSGNKLTRLRGLDDSHLITFLKVANNKLTGEGLDLVRSLPLLAVLNAAGNGLTRLPALERDSGSGGFRKLSALVLNDNALTSDALVFLPRLRALNTLVVSRNSIERLDSRLLKPLGLLTKISAAHNQLRAFPDVRHCPKMRELRLAHNNIEAVPAWVATATPALSIVDLGSNKVSQWDAVAPLERLEGLMQLHLRDNPIAGSFQALETVEKADDGDADADGAEAADKDTRLAASVYKQYCFQVKRRFPKLKVRDGHRKLAKRSHGLKRPPREQAQPPSQGQGQTEGSDQVKGRGQGSDQDQGRGYRDRPGERDGQQGRGAADDGKKRYQNAERGKRPALETTHTEDSEHRATKKHKGIGGASSDIERGGGGGARGGGGWLDQLHQDARSGNTGATASPEENTSEDKKEKKSKKKKKKKHEKDEEELAAEAKALKKAKKAAKKQAKKDKKQKRKEGKEGKESHNNSGGDDGDDELFIGAHGTLHPTAADANSAGNAKETRTKQAVSSARSGVVAVVDVQKQREARANKSKSKQRKKRGNKDGGSDGAVTADASSSDAGRAAPAARPAFSVDALMNLSAADAPEPW